MAAAYDRRMGEATTLLTEAASVAREHADEADRIRRLPTVTVDALTAAGALAMCLPEAYGGPGTGSAL